MPARNQGARAEATRAGSPLRNHLGNDSLVKKSIEGERRLGIGRISKGEKALSRRELDGEADLGLAYLPMRLREQLLRSYGHLHKGEATPQDVGYLRRHGLDFGPLHAHCKER